MIINIVRLNYKIIIFGFVFTFFSSIGQSFFIGLFNANIREEINISHGEFGVLYGIATLCSSLVLIWVGKKIDDVKLVNYSIFVVLFLFFASAFFSFINNLIFLFLGIFFLRLSGQGLMAHTASTAISRYFEKRRGKALSYIWLGMSLGEFLLPIIIIYLISFIYWRDLWIYISLVILLILPFFSYSAVRDIDFSSREELRMGHVNTLKYNLIYDKHLRRILPYYVLFEFSKESKDSQICVNGNSYYYFLDESEKGKKINNLEFIKNKSNDCINLDKDFEKFYLIGFSINDSDNLEIIFKKSVYLKFYQVINFIVILLILVCCYNLLSIKISTNTIIYLVSIISTFLIALVKYNNQIFGFRYYRGGADGILHNSFGQDIIINILNHNFLEAIRGSESVFYNMPGHRYFNAFSKIFFGDTNYGYMVLVSLLPLLIYIFFKKYLSKKYAIYLFTSFIFLPIFENMGFGYFNYIWQMIRNHAESFSIVLIISCLIGIHNIDNKKLVPFESFKVFFIGLLLAFASISRPNFFPTCLILSLYIFLNYFFLQKKYLQSYSILIGFSAVLFCFLHNIYFANFFNFFVHQVNAVTGNFQLMNLNTIIKGLSNILIFNFNNEHAKIIFSQFALWNPLYNTHRLIMLAVIFYYIYRKKQTLLTYVIFLCMISQHCVLLMTRPDSRYAYLAWLLTIILFFKVEYQNKIVVRLMTFSKKIFTKN